MDGGEKRFLTVGVGHRPFFPEFVKKKTNVAADLSHQGENAVERKLL